MKKGKCVRKVESQSGKEEWQTGEFQVVENIVSKENCNTKCSDMKACKAYEFGTNKDKDKRICNLYFIDIKEDEIEENNGLTCNIYRESLGGTRILQFMDRKTYEMVTRKAFKTEDPTDLEIKFPRTYKWRWTLNT